MKHWQDVLVTIDTKIRRVIEVIDTHALQIALIVDENGVLLGTVTDGDIRRAILKGISIEEGVEKIINRKPATASEDETREHVLKRMSKSRFRHLPIIDANRKVIGMHVLEQMLAQGDKDNWVVLMAGGQGKRMTPLTENCPKPMLKVGGKPILEIILGNLVDYGLKNFYISLNYKGEMIESHFKDGAQWKCQIRYIRESEPLGTAGALGLLPERPTQPFIVMNGDLLTKVNFDQLLDFHRERKAKITMCVREHELEVPYGVVQLERQKIASIDEKPVQRFFVNGGIYVLEPEVLDEVPKGQPLDMPELLQRLIAKKVPTAAFPMREYWLDVGRHSDFDRAHIEWEEEN